MMQGRDRARPSIRAHHREQSGRLGAAAVDRPGPQLARGPVPALRRHRQLLQVQPVIDATLQRGYPRDSVFALGVILLSCVVACVIPQTSVLGALLLTGYLGGAVATHVRVGNPLFSHVLFPTYVAALTLWGGLILRNPRLRHSCRFVGRHEPGQIAGRAAMPTLGPAEARR
jgi:hypothetical protein